MTKKLLAGVLVCALLMGSSAFAQSPEERMEHLFSHGKRETFFCSGRLVKLRVAPNANKMHGRAVLGDQFRLLDSFGEWVRVEMTDVLPENRDARKGMTGWIHVDHIACACDMKAAEEAAFDETEKE